MYENGPVEHESAFRFSLLLHLLNGNVAGHLACGTHACTPIYSEILLAAFPTELDHSVLITIWAASARIL